MQRLQECEAVLKTLAKLKPGYQKEGLELLGIFGSVARGTQDAFSDVDIVYKLDLSRMQEHCGSAANVLLCIEDIKAELEAELKRRVDLLPDKNEDCEELGLYLAHDEFSSAKADLEDKTL